MTRTTMTRQHFCLIAEAIAGLPMEWRPMIAKRFADKLAATNGRFDRDRFLSACGVE
jgi:hypothetical protein